MKTSKLGQDFIKSFEKCRLVAYPDEGGIWTLGWGHTEGVKQGDHCTLEQADIWFASDLSVFERAIERLVHVPISQQQHDALAPFTYNNGIGALSMSTLLRKLNEHNYMEAANNFELWNKVMVDGRLVPSAGLTKRRRAERRIFLEGVYEMHDGPTIDSKDMPDFGDVQAGVVK
jgi:lysozyme